jgi:hypothetical protein
MPRYLAERDCFVANRYVREGTTVDLDAADGNACAHLVNLDAPPVEQPARKSKD